MKRYKYYLSESANCYSINANNKKEAIKGIRKCWKLSYYQTKKIDIWEAEKTVEQEIVEKQEFYKDVLSKNSHLCLTDM